MQRVSAFVVLQFARWMRRAVIDFGGEHVRETVVRDSELALGRKFDERSSS